MALCALGRFFNKNWCQSKQPSNPWKIFKDEDNVNVLSKGPNGYSITISTSTNYFPVILTVGVVAGTCVLIFLTILACWYCRRQSGDRTTVAPPAAASSDLASPQRQQPHAVINCNASPVEGAALYPNTSVYQPGGELYPAVTPDAYTSRSRLVKTPPPPYKTETDMEDPPAYESQRLLQTDVRDDKPPPY